jgi:hypothetical protein
LIREIRVISVIRGQKKNQMTDAVARRFSAYSAKSDVRFDKSGEH